MATNLKNLSVIDTPIPNAEDMMVGIVVAQWNRQVTEPLLKGAVETLMAAGCAEENIIIKWVPGTFEIPMAVQLFAEHTEVDGVIALGCVIQGETRHFDFICQGVTQGIMDLTLQWSLPIAFGILTTDNQQQALDRAGGKHGNKGVEAAVAVMQMIELQIEMDDEDEISSDESVN